MAKGTDWADEIVEDFGKQDEESMVEAADQLDEKVEEAKEQDGASPAPEAKPKKTRRNTRADDSVRTVGHPDYTPPAGAVGGRPLAESGNGIVRGSATFFTTTD